MSKEEKQVNDWLKQMEKQSLPIQQGGFVVEAIPTGISSFDHSTGVGGIPRRRVTLLEGEEASGKTLLLLVLIASVQKDGGRAAFVDLEHALTPSFAEMLGVDYDSLFISRPKNLNEAYDVSKEAVSSGLFDVVGFDSAVALTTVDNIEKSASDGEQRAAEAQVHSQELKKLVSCMDDRTAFVVVNQLREDPNPPAWYTGKRLYAPGGRALRHYASLRVNIKATQTYKNAAGMRVGHKARTRCVKNKVAQPYRTAEFDLYYDTGLDLLSDLVSTAIRLGIVQKRSSWFSMTVVDLEEGEVLDEIKEQGREAFETALRDHEDAQKNLSRQIAASDEFEEEEAKEDASGWEDVR